MIKKWNDKNVIRAGAGHYFWQQVGFEDSNPFFCWEWLGKLDKDGYGQLKGVGAHRIAWELASGQKIEKGQVVMHTCDTPSCCRPSHLLLGSHKANAADRAFKFRSAAGTKNGRSKLVNAQVIEIYQSTAPCRALARQFDIDESTVRGIKSGITWSWLTAPYSKGVS